MVAIALIDISTHCIVDDQNTCWLLVRHTPITFVKSSAVAEDREFSATKLYSRVGIVNLTLEWEDKNMPYSKFTLSKAVDDFELTIIEGVRFLPEILPVNPTSLLRDTLKETLPWAIAVSSEKARSEGIINPVLLEVKRQLNGEIGVFSGEEFNVQPEVDLTGYVDFLISRSPEQLFIKAPAVVLVEAEKEDLKPALGQCLAEMVAAQRFNQQKQQPISTIYGTVTSDTVWRLLKLEGQTVTIDLTDYPLPPVEQILGFLVWMVQNG